MSDIVLSVENVSKLYRIGSIGTGSLAHDLNRLWHRFRGKEDPYLKIGETNDRTRQGQTDYVWALQNVGLSVRKGEVLGVIGRNGAGKSTLLKILSRITSPTSGIVRMKGRTNSLLEVGTGFHPDLTGRQNVYMNGAIHGLSRSEISAKFDEIVEFSGVERYIDTPVKRYSSGMQVRLGFAVAAHLEPEILIVDEVLAVGDLEFQRKCLGKMKTVASSDRTVLFVSHSMGTLKQLCNRAILLEQGRCILEGPTHQVIDEYLKDESTTSSSSDLRSTPRRGDLGKRARISRFFSLSSSDASKFRVPRGEPLRLGIEVELLDDGFPVKECSVVLGVDDLNQNRIFSTESRRSGLLLDLTPGQPRHQVTAEIHGPNLKPGRYKLTFGLRQGLKGIDQVTWDGELMITSEDWQGIFEDDSLWGYVSCESSWRVEELQ